MKNFSEKRYFIESFITFILINISSQMSAQVKHKNDSSEIFLEKRFIQYVDNPKNKNKTMGKISFIFRHNIN